MSSSPPPSTITTKKPIRELNSITNRLLLSKTLNALVSNNNNNNNIENTPPSLTLPPPPPPSTSSIKENIPNDSNSIQQQKALNLRLAAALKPADRDNVAALFQFYQTLTNNHVNNQDSSSPSLTNNNNNSNLNNLSLLKQQNATKRYQNFK